MLDAADVPGSVVWSDNSCMTDSVTRSFVRVRCVACVAALLGIFAVDGGEVCAQRARLENVARTLSETWRWRVYTREQGLSSNTVTALYQDPQNDVYAATTVGICRFDLWRWHVVENSGALGREAAQFAESPTDLFVSNRRGVWRVLGDGRLAQLRSGESLHMDQERSGPGSDATACPVVFRGSRRFVRRSLFG